MRVVQSKGIYVLMGVSLSFLLSCSTSPMQSRLDKNFVYHCSLELIKKDVPASEAERVCTASHRAEQVDEDRKNQKYKPPAVMAEPAPSVQKTDIPEAGDPIRTPASQP
jgi:hypothetical protein